MEIKFCPKCHREAFRIKENGENIEIIQGGRTFISMSKNSSTSISINCPLGHKVKLKVGGNGRET